MMGGQMAKPGEFPYAICIYGANRCGGALVSMERFITAGQCFIYEGVRVNISKQIVVAGVVDCNQSDDPYYQQRGITEYLMPPGFKAKKDRTYYHDIAVGYLDKPFIESSRVKAGSLPTGDPDLFRQYWLDYIKTGEQCIVIGFEGREVDEDVYPLQYHYDLKIAPLQPRGEKSCKRTIIHDTDKLLDGEVCALLIHYTKQAMTQDDSGSAFTCDGVLLGVYNEGAVLSGEYFQFFTLAYPYLKFFSLDSAVIPRARLTHVILGIVTVSLIWY